MDALRHVILITYREWFNAALDGRVKVFDTPVKKSRWHPIGKLSPGSVCVIFCRRDRVFLGEIRVSRVREIDGREYHRLVESGLVWLKPGVWPPREITERDRVWIIEFENITKYPREVPKDELVDVKTKTSRKPIAEWKLTGATLIDEEALSGIRRHAGLIETPRPLQVTCPSHSEIQEMLIDIGSILGFHVEREYYSPDRVYRYDVAWMELPEHSPLKVFEIVKTSDVDKALASLQHASDMWRPRLYLVIEDEKDLERAMKLVKPRLSGAFARIAKYLTILTCTEVVNLYMDIKKHEKLLRELAKHQIE